MAFIDAISADVGGVESRLFAHPASYFPVKK